MSVADRLNKLSTDITNAYTSIENKGGTIPANKNTNNLSTAINSIEVIEQATAEGESLSLTNTKAMPYSDYVVEGKSEQETGKSKNLYSGGNKTFTSYLYRFPVEPIPAGTYIFSADISSTDTDYPLALAIFYGENGQVGARNLHRTIGQDSKVSESITLTDTCTSISFYASNNAVNSEGDTATFSNVMISAEGGAYEPYGEKPSPSNPSEIHSVADDVNILNYGTKEFTSFYQEYGLNIPAGTYTFSAKVTSNDTTYNISRVYFYDANGTSLGFVSLSRDERASGTITLSGTAVRATLYSSIDYSSSNGKTATYEDIKIQKGTTSTPYSPYNQGTVTIKQRGKNLFDGEIELGNINPDNGSLSNSTTRTRSKNFIKVEPNTTYSYYHTLGENRWIVGYTENKIGISDGIQSHPSALKEQFLSAGNTFQFTTSPTTEYIKWYDTNCTDLTERVQLEQGSTATSYEPYQANDYTIQTEPLRSLPNGVKDTIEADGIHRRVGRIIVDNGYIINTSSWNGYVISTSDKKYQGNNSLLCTNAIFVNSSNIQEGTIYENPAGAVLVGNSEDTLETLKAKYDGAELLYELEEEVIEPLTQNQVTTMLDIIKTGSYEGTTNISTDEDVKPTMKVDYYKKA